MAAPPSLSKLKFGVDPIEQDHEKGVYTPMLNNMKRTSISRKLKSLEPTKKIQKRNTDNFSPSKKGAKFEIEDVESEKMKGKKGIAYLKTLGNYLKKGRERPTITGKLKL
jgi:hypothetical protein